MQTDRTIVEIFDEISRRCADKVAVTDDFGRQLSYSELADLSDSIACTLLERGLRTGDAVGVCISRTVHIAPTIFGILKAGGTFVPMNEDYPSDRMSYMLEDCNAGFLITTHSVLNEKGNFFPSEKTVFLDDIEYKGTPEGLVFPVIGPDTRAVILYTSGTTGRPKGVVYDHRGLPCILNLDFFPDADGSMVTAVFASFTFVASFLFLVTPLLKGGATYIVSENNRTDIPNLVRSLRQFGVTHMFLPSSLGAFIAEHYDLSGIYVGLAGEKVPKFTPVSSCVFFSMYGSTEGAPIIIGRIDDYESNIPLGQPVGHAECLLVDDKLCPVGGGEAGELIYHSELGAKEYLNKPELTAEKWVFINGKRYFRTGDRMTRDANGTYYFVGRTDFLLKIRGNRVEPGEVENNILESGSSKGLKRVVCVQRTVDGADNLCCFYESEGELDINAVKADISARLPEYMVPSVWVRVSEWPLNDNGKVIRDRLTVSEGKSGSSELTSIQAMRIVSDIYHKRGIRLKFTDVMKVRSEEELEQLIGCAEQEARPEDEQTVRPKVSVSQLSFPQRGIFADCIANPDSVSYNLPSLVHIPEGIDTEKLCKALRDLVEAHPGINVELFTDEKGQTCLKERILKGNEIPIEIKRIGKSGLEDCKAGLVRPFNLTDGSLLYRFEIILTDEGRQYLFVDFHHLVFDGSSFNVFLTGLASLLEGKTCRPETYSYLQFAHSQELFEDTEEWNSEREWWIEQVGRIESSSELIPDIYGKGETPGDEKRVSVPVDDRLLKKALQKYDTHRSTVFLASALYAIKAYTANPEVGIATISSGRQNPDIAGNLGMFVNTLPFTIKIEDTPIKDYLDLVQNRMLDCIGHDQFPFYKTVAETGYQLRIMFAFQDSVIEDVSISGSRLVYDNMEQGSAKFPVYIIATSEEGKPKIEIRYDGNLYSEQMMQGLCDCMAHIIAQLPERSSLSELEYCTPEMTGLLDSFNPDTPSDYTDNATVVSMFREAASRFPDNTAAVFKDRKYSYRELDALTDRLAVAINDRIKGTDRPEPVVSILIHRNEYMFIASVAALKAGCAYQPLDPSYPSDRLNYMMEDAQASLLIADEDLCHLVDGYKGGTLLTKDIPEILKDAGEISLEGLREPEPESLFILLYTSGSTGKPKGVMLEHQNLVAFCHWHHRYYGLTPADNVAAYASFGFDACMMDLYPALTCGATVHIIPEEIRLDLDAINNYFEQNAISVSFITTQVGVQFLQCVKNHSLRHLSVGGEKLVSVNPAEGYTFHNGYGPTECTIFTTTFPVLKKEPNIPVGRPVDSLKCIVADKNLHRLPVGAAGELIIMGKQVSRGYLNQKEKTAEAFFTYRGMRAYHSGDIVRYRNDGNIEFVGRKDGQVKIRGFRIELKEVEAVFRECPGIRDVTVQAFDNPAGGKFIAAYYVSDSELEISDIQTFIKERKPAYMVPAVIIRIDHIPLNINQKVDKKALPEPVVANSVAFVEPEGRMETEIASAFQAVLGIEQPVSALDDFAELGGDSIKAIRLTSVLRQKKISVLVSQILQRGSVRSIAQVASFQEETLTFSQEAFEGIVEDAPLLHYFNALDMPLPGYFNQAFIFSAARRIDRTALETALTALAVHHDMLRAVMQDGHLTVRPADSENLYSLEESDGSDITGQSVRVQASIDLEKGPLMKCVIFRTEKSDLLLIAIHHLVVDGISWRILGEDLNTAYSQAQRDRKIELQPKTASFDLYARTLVKYRQSHILLHQREYWNTVLGKKKLHTLSWPKEKGFTVRALNAVLDERQTSLLMKKSFKAYNTQPDDLFLTAIGMAYHKFSGEDALTVQLESHGREVFDSDIAIDRTVGWFTAIFPVVLEDLSGDVHTMIRQVKQTRHSIPNKGFGCQQLFGVDTVDQPLLTFNYLGELNEHQEGLMFEIDQKYSAGKMIAPENCYGTDITINCLQQDGRIIFVIDYNGRRFSDEQMQDFVNLIMESIGRIIEHTSNITIPESTASDFGEFEWTDKEFKELQDDYLFRNEHIKFIRNLTPLQLRKLHSYILDPDSLVDIRTFFLELSADFDRTRFGNALAHLFQRHECLRSTISLYGTDKPRMIVTDRRPMISYYDYSDLENPYESLNRLKDLLKRFPFDLQMEPPLRIVAARTAAQQTFILMYCQTALMNMRTVRQLTIDFLDRLGDGMEDSGNLNEWKELLAEANDRDDEDMKGSAVNGSDGTARGIPPAPGIEQQIALNFSELLDRDIDDIFSDSDFIRMGGENFDLIGLSDTINREYSVLIPPAKLRENPTVAGIASLIGNKDKEDEVEDVYVYSDIPGKKRLFFVHTANTGSEAYFNLAQRISKSCSFYAFEQYNLNHMDAPLTGGIPEIAAKYISIMRKYQPHGPYLLGGWCYGGSVAFEMARQLTAQGESVENVIMLDSHIIEDEKMRRSLLRSSIAHSRKYLSTAELFAGLRSKGLLEKLIANSRSVTRNWLNFNPQHYSGKVVYFKALRKEEGLTAVSDKMYDILLAQRAAGYEKRVDEDKMTIVNVEIGHDSMMNESSLDVIVPVIKKILEG